MTLDARHDSGFFPFDALCDGAAFATTSAADAGEVGGDLHRIAVDAAPAGRRVHGLSRAALCRVEDFLDRHIGDHFRLGDMAQAACMSQFHFTRRFKESLQRSPMQYVLEKRIELAKLRLASGEEKLAAIAFDLGFCDQSHFARSFRRFTGMSPSAFASRQASKSAWKGSGSIP